MTVTRHLFRTLVLLLVLLTPVTARAACDGQDLLAAMPRADRQALETRANAAPFARGNLWQASKGDLRVTLVGTYHLDDPRFGPLVADLAPALAAAHTLLVEASAEDIAALQAKVTADPSLIISPGGGSLYADLPRETWTGLAQQLKGIGIPGPIAARLRPWYVMVLLSTITCEGAGTPDGGLDMRLISAARDRGLPVRGLEPADTILTLFNRVSREDQIALLTTALAEASNAEDGMTTLIEAYFRGESRLMWEFVAWETAQLPGISADEARRQQDLMGQILITDRNRAWIPVIERTARDGPVLAAFGALHLPGAEGVLNLLAQDGWTIQPLQP
jgi:uncharacterized protein YbaP (TraB family)